MVYSLSASKRYASSLVRMGNHTNTPAGQCKMTVMFLSLITKILTCTLITKMNLYDVLIQI